MTFNPFDEPVDHILLGPQQRRSPGIAVVSAASSPRRWDERRGYALSGATIRFRGNGLAHPVVTLRLLTTQHMRDWHAWRDLVERPAPGERAPFHDIWHPILEDLGILKVGVENVLQPKQVADGEWAVQIKFIEYRRPVPTLEAGEAPEEEPTGRIGLLTAIAENDGEGSVLQALAADIEP